MISWVSQPFRRMSGFLTDFYEKNPFSQPLFSLYEKLIDFPQDLELDCLPSFMRKLGNSMRRKAGAVPHGAWQEARLIHLRPAGLGPTVRAPCPPPPQQRVRSSQIRALKSWSAMPQIKRCENTQTAEQGLLLLLPQSLLSGALPGSHGLISYGRCYHSPLSRWGVAQRTYLVSGRTKI